MRTTRDGRIVFGWGGGAMGMGGRASDRLELDGDVVAETERALRRFFPQTRGRAVTHAWGGPIDVSPTHLPIFGSRGRVHHGFGFTGNGVGPSYLGGETSLGSRSTGVTNARGSLSSNRAASSFRPSRSATSAARSSAAP